MPVTSPSVLCPPEKAVLCGALKGKCDLVRVGQTAAVYERDGGNSADLLGRTTAVISARRCTEDAIRTYLPPAARPAYRPAPDKLPSIFRS